MPIRSISRHVAWVEENLPELAHLGQREVDKVIARSERGVMSARVVLYIGSMLLAQPASVFLAESFGFHSYVWAYRISLVVCLVPLLLLSNYASDKIWRWQIRRAIQV